MAVYGTASQTVALVGLGAWVKVFGGRISRTGLTFLPASNALIDLANEERAASSRGIIQIYSTLTFNMRTYDWGPIVTGEIWLASKSANVSVTVTETYLIRR